MQACLFPSHALRRLILKAWLSCRAGCTLRTIVSTQKPVPSAYSNSVTPTFCIFTRSSAWGCLTVWSYGSTLKSSSWSHQNGTGADLHMAKINICMHVDSSLLNIVYPLNHRPLSEKHRIEFSRMVIKIQVISPLTGFCSLVGFYCCAA